MNKKNKVPKKQILLYTLYMAIKNRRIFGMIAKKVLMYMIRKHFVFLILMLAAFIGFIAFLVFIFSKII